MILRPYQEDIVNRAKKALLTHGNTLVVSPTGSGKTIMLGALASKMRAKNGVKKVCVLQHRDELVEQNLNKYLLTNPGVTFSVVNGASKDWRGEAVFAMAQTLGRETNLVSMPPLDLLIIDEAHHAIAAGYQRIVDKALEKNPDCKIAGFTATPNRGDGKGLRPIFDNCCAQLSLQHLIALGHLVKPKMYICELAGVGERLKDVRKVGGEYDMDQVESILDVEVHNKTVVEKWRSVAGDRKTIVFCSTVKHACDVCEVFQKAGVKSAVVTGETPQGERAAILEAFDRGNLQVLCNVAVLTEGYDSQPVSCIVLLRPCSYESTMIQMIGRGLRTVDPTIYPDVVKKDCIVIDFGNSLKVHGRLDAKIQLDDKDKACIDCGARIPCTAEICPICGHEFIAATKETSIKVKDNGEVEIVKNVELQEVDIFKMSPFRWIDLFDTNKILIACGFSAWCAVCSVDAKNYVALGKLKTERGLQVLMRGDKVQALAAADDFLRFNEDSDSAAKNKRWLNDLATSKQLELLRQVGYNDSFSLAFTKYSAACTLNFFWNQQAIEREVFKNAD